MYVYVCDVCMYVCVPRVTYINNRNCDENKIMCGHVQCLYSCMQAYMYVCLPVCVHVCMCVRTYVFLHVCKYYTQKHP